MAPHITAGYRSPRVIGGDHDISPISGRPTISAVPCANPNVLKVELATGDRARVDARMELGTVQENLTVSGEAPLLQTDSATVSSLIDQKTVQDAPIPGTKHHPHGAARARRQ